MKPSLFFRSVRPSLRLSAIALTASAAIAADVANETQSAAFAVVNDDLLQSSLASITDSLTYNPSYNPAGKVAADLYDGDSSGEPVIQDGTLTFNLNTTTNTAGYNLASIVTFTNHPDGGRDGQSYSVSYSSVSAPTTFIPITSVNYLMGDNGTPGSGKVTITNIGASNVAAVRFTFNTQENWGSTWAEIDITGTPSSAITEQNGTWTATADGNWTDAANWLDSKPAAGTNRTANFTGTTGVIVAVDAARSIGNLVFDNADYTLNGPAGLSLVTSSGTPSINVGDTGGLWTATISAPLAATNGFTKTGNGILSLRSPLSGVGPVLVQSGILEMIETTNGGPGDYNWYLGVTSTTVQSGAVLSINSHSGILNLTLAGGELASGGTDPFYGYGSWSLQGNACTATGGVTSTISAQQVDFNSLTNGFVVETGSTLEITGSLKNGPLMKNGPGLMVLMAPRTGTDNTFVNEGTLQVSDAGGSLRFRPTTVGSVNSITGDIDASLAYNGAMVFDLSAAILSDGNTWQVVNTTSFSTPGSLTFGANFMVRTDSQDFTETSLNSGIWELPVTGAKWTFTEATGILKYTVTATDYDTWAGSFSLTGGPAGDDDNDGMTNFEEYAFGRIPNSGASSNPIATVLNKFNGQFTYIRRDPTKPNPALTYSVWYSTDLVVWLKDTGAVEGTTSLNGDVQTVPVTISSSLLTNPKLFIQVRAE